MKNTAYRTQKIFFALGTVCTLTVFGGDGLQALARAKERILEINAKHRPETDGVQNTMSRGYAAQEAKRILTRAGIREALIVIGETVVNIGTVRRVGLQDPFGKADQNFAYFDIGEKSIVSAGLYTRGFEEHSKALIYGDKALAAITLIGDDAVQLSALCCKASGLSAADAMALLNNTDVEAIFVTRGQSVLCTDGLNKHPASNPQRSVAKEAA